MKCRKSFEDYVSMVREAEASEHIRKHDITFGGGQKYDVQCISTFFIFQRSADDLSAILDEAILAHSFGAMDVKTCGDKVLCEIFIPKESLYDALPQRSSHTLRNFVQEKFREHGEFLDLERCQYYSKDFCSLTDEQIEAIIDTPMPETR